MVASPRPNSANSRQLRTADSRRLSDVTAVIKTFERPRCLDVLIRSLRKFYPSMRILVGDDSFRPQLRRDVDYLVFEPDIGISAGRNRLLAKVETPYFLLLDDDLEFTAQTRIERLAEVAKQPGITLAAGDYIRCKKKFGLFTTRRPQPYHGTFHFDGDHLHLVRGHRGQQSGYYLCDLVHNFYVARTDEVRRIGGWDERLKLHEHEDFFLRLGTCGGHAAFCPEVTALHWNSRSPRRYSRFRGRDYLPLALAINGISRYTTPDGRTIESLPSIAERPERKAA